MRRGYESKYAVLGDLCEAERVSRVPSGEFVWTYNFTNTIYNFLQFGWVACSSTTPFNRHLIFSSHLNVEGLKKGSDHLVSIRPCVRGWLASFC